MEAEKWLDWVEKAEVVEVDEDKAYNGQKVFVTLEIPLEEDRPRDLEQFFHLDDMKRKAIRAAEAQMHRSAGWSDVGRLQFFKDGESVNWVDGADAVRVRYTCLGAL